MRGVSIINFLYPLSMFVIGLSVVIQPLPNLEPFAALLLIALLAALLIALVTGTLVWVEKQGTLWTRMHYTLVALAAGVMCFWYHTWNMLGLWRF
jgi:uncharacterized membrane protein YuzA (DUF378 family)